MTHVVAFRLRNADDPTEIYGTDIPDEEQAMARAQQLADFYQRRVEVCEAALGRVTRTVDIIEPGPLAPELPFGGESGP